MNNYDALVSSRTNVEDNEIDDICPLEWKSEIFVEKFHLLPTNIDISGFDRITVTKVNSQKTF